MNHTVNEQAGAAEAKGKAFDLFNIPDAYYENPVPYWRALRDDSPVHWNSDGSLLLTRYGDVKAVWQDGSASVDKREMFTAKFGQGPLLEHHTTSMLFRDPPDHDRLRGVVELFFTPRSVERMRAATQDIIDSALAGLDGRDEIDLVADFTSHIPVQVICEIFGVPRTDGPYIRSLGAKVLAPLNPAVSPQVIADGHAGVAEFKAYLMGHIQAQRKREPEEVPTNVISAMVAAERKGVQISEDEMAHMCILLLNGGAETTTNLLGLSTLAIIGHPSERAVIEDPACNVSLAVEELLRYWSPLQLQGRRTTREVKIPSGVVPAGTEVIISQGSANRDERTFEAPDVLKLTRAPNPHLAFGSGFHVCIGRHLSRMETTIALPALFRRFPRMDLNGTPTFFKAARFRGLSSLPLRLR